MASFYSPRVNGAIVYIIFWPIFNIFPYSEFSDSQFYVMFVLEVVLGVCITGTLLCSGTLNFVTSEVSLYIYCLALPASCFAPVGFSLHILHPLGTLSTDSSAKKNR